MTFKEFKKWCNERACDGCLGLKTFIVCREIMETVRMLPFWKREKKWREINAKFAIEEEIVKHGTQFIKELYDKENANV